jgi:hypothetical protein
VEESSLVLAALAVRLLAEVPADAADLEAAALVSQAADAFARGDASLGAALARRARSLLRTDAGAGATPPLPGAASQASSHYLQQIALPGSASPPAARLPGEFVFATARYESGNWDSAPLVPTNLVHSLAQYTGIAVAPEGVYVDLGSPLVFRHPFLFLTGHLPVRFTAQEAANLKAYVERGGFIFVDDHNHDIDGAFHRTVTAELARIFGNDALEQLPNDHELYGAFIQFDRGPPTTSHELNGWGDGLIHEHLYTIMVGNRIGLLYSNKDYASEWNYHAENKRFLGPDNTRFGVNILVYALTR